MVAGQVEIHTNYIPVLCMNGNVVTPQLKYCIVGIFRGGWDGGDGGGGGYFFCCQNHP